MTEVWLRLESFDTGSFWKQIDFQPSSITSVVEINDRIFDWGKFD